MNYKNILLKFLLYFSLLSVFSFAVFIDVAFSESSQKNTLVQNPALGTLTDQWEKTKIFHGITALSSFTLPRASIFEDSEDSSTHSVISSTYDHDKITLRRLALNDLGTPEETSAETASRVSENTNESTNSLLEERILLEKQVQQKPFIVSLHRPNYFLGATYNKNPNRELYENAGMDAPKHYEAKFQFSVRLLAWPDIFKGKADLYAAYTQQSLWQVYSYSSPFRETNFEPEILLSFDTDFNFLGLRNRLFILGLNHQSNGMGPELSRSWNRIHMEFIAGKGNFLAGLKAWYRIPEKAEEDDNPDIEDYVGHGQIFGAYKYRKNVFSFMLRNNLKLNENKGSFEVGWSYPIIRSFRVYMQYFNGYGESLADYNIPIKRIGIGVMINDWI